MITKRPTLHVYDIKFKDTSWELKQKLSKYLGGVEVEFLGSGCHGFTVTSLGEIRETILSRIDELLLKWAKEIKDKNTQEEADDLKEIKEWLKTFKLPEMPKKKGLKDLWNNIQNLHDELISDSSRGEVTPCGLGDITDLLELFKLLEKGEIEKAKKSLWSMDTGTRDYIPDSCRRMMNEEED